MKKTLKQVFVVLIMIGCLIPVLSSTSEAATSTYIVQSGDSLWKVANKYDTTITTLRQLNNLRSNYLEVGDQLQVPSSAKSYTVQWGDSLWKISQKTGVSITAIKEANNLYSNNIEMGQVLIIPSASAPAPIPTPTPTPTPEPTPEPEIELTKTEIDLLARLVYAEAQGEPYRGKVAVAAVILNRIKSSDFPNTLNGVVYQKFAFQPVGTGYIWTVHPDATVYQATKEALNGADPTDGALYFFNPDKVVNPNNWVWTREVTLIIGNHTFAI